MKTVKKALDILESYTRDVPAQGVTEIANRLGFHKSTTHALLTTLKKAGYLIFDPKTRKYSLGFKLMELASRVSYQRDLSEICSPIMQELSRSCKEDVSLSIPIEGKWVIIAIVRGTQFVRQNITLGMAVPLYCGAGGKCILAFSEKPAVEKLLEEYGFVQYTPNTITDKNRLFQELEKIRSQGYAESYGEFFPDAAALAYPIFSGKTEIMGAYSIHSTLSRLTSETKGPLIASGLQSAQKTNELLANLNLEM